MNEKSAGSPEAAAAQASAVPGRERMGWWLALAILIYSGGYLLWYLGTPLGRAPQLDGRENLELAAQIAGGTLPHELFYRAMLYPAVLAVPLVLGWPVAWLAELAAVLGLLCHFAATLAVARLAARVWAGPRAGAAAWLAAAWWGLNPVALFYAVDVLDATPALALFLWGLVWLAKPRARAWEALAGGALLGLAVAMRPHFLPVALIAPVARAWLAGRWRPVPGDGWAWAGAALPLLAMGLAQAAWAGEFRVLPWQGAYNFYAANRLGANGRYYAQRMFFADLTPGENPTRVESQLQYTQETGAKPPFDITGMEGYWHARAWAEIGEHPAAWLKLMGRKAYYLFNDFDQYNNKTYAWHQERSPWLRWNFLSWGVLLVLAAAILPLGWGVGVAGREPRLASMLLVFAAYGAGVLVYYASGRFRLPLTPLLCVLAGGWAGGRELLKTRAGLGSARLMMLAGLAAVVAGLVAATNFFGARDESTFIQDELLSANAAAEVGEDAQAYNLAEEALARDGKRPDARRMALVSYFNMAVAGEPGTDAAEAWRKQLPLLEGLNLRDPALALAAGTAWWKTGDKARAEAIWQDAAKRFGADSAPAQALAAARSLRKESVPGGPAPNEAYLEYLARPN